MNALLPSETNLIGQWIDNDGSVAADEVEKRITWLLTNALVKVSAGNWTVLYREPADDRLWELTYPDGEWHGGGPRRLTVVAREEAIRRYPGAAL